MTDESPGPAYGGGVADMMRVASAMMAFQRQAGEQLVEATEALSAAGLGFSEELENAITASHATHLYPEGYDPAAGASAETVAEAQEVGRRAMEADYPENGFAPDDPRIQPIEGVSLALMAIAAKAVGWNTDEAYIERVVTALGIDPEVWKRVGEAWRARVADDIVVGAFYGQLYAQA